MTDMAKVGGADLAKLAANRVDLLWSDKDLYGMLLKRMRNSQGPLADYIGQIRGIEWDSDTTLGELLFGQMARCPTSCKTSGW